MKNEITDEKLKNLFREMRIEDEEGTPSFQQTVPRHVPSISPFPSVWRLATAMALIILLGAGTAIFLISQPETSQDYAHANWEALSNWKASTDDMLALAGTKIDGTLTTSTDSLLEVSYESVTAIESKN